MAAAKDVSGRKPQADERGRWIAADWNESTADHPSKTMHQLFEECVDESPDAIALVHGEQRLTYSELNSSANRVARHLRAAGIGPDRLVGICMHRRVEMIIGVLAVLKAGGAYVPLDPTYPPARLAGMTNDIDLPVLLTTRDLASDLPASRAQVACLEQVLSENTELDAENLAGTVSLDNLCYVIFTSGSTGKPKAAAVFHRGWVNLVSWFVREFVVNATDKVLVISSFSFDITQRSIAMPLIAGGQLHLLASNLYDPGLISSTIREQQVTRVNCAPSTFYPLVENPTRATFENLRALKTVFLGGEPISAARMRQWAEGATTEIANVYGAAECSDVSSFYRLKDYDRYVRTSVPIGKPIANSRLYLLDETLAPVPAGEVGEICIAGVGVGKGYINDSELTDEKFIPNPFSDCADARLYRTGDLARLGPDWNLEFIGRVDHQVKIRGFRVHLGDVEMNLRQCPGVREAVVLKKTFAADDDRLMAYIVPMRHPAPAALVNEVRLFLRDRVPEYMLPSGFMLLRQLPLNPNGKIDREALLTMEDGGGGRLSDDAPAGEVEQEVAVIFADSLKLDGIGMDDDFFDLGGDSLKAVLVVAHVANRLGRSVPLETLFETRTIRKFCQRIEAVQR
jgi:amino acid adenylation domain-containing protein